MNLFLYTCTMRIETITLNRWRKVAKVRGMKTKCHNKTKLGRDTINRVLETGEMQVGVFAVLSKFFNKQKS